MYRKCIQVLLELRAGGDISYRSMLLCGECYNTEKFKPASLYWKVNCECPLTSFCFTPLTCQRCESPWWWQILNYCLSGSALGVFIQNTHHPHLWEWSDFYRSIVRITTCLKWNRHFFLCPERLFLPMSGAVSSNQWYTGIMLSIFFITLIYLYVCCVCPGGEKTHYGHPCALGKVRLLKVSSRSPWFVIAGCIPASSTVVQARLMLSGQYI